MDKNNEKLLKWLFETNAVRVCPEDKPFWYTSGTIGPYYINTHFLYGSEEKANKLLEFIDREKDNILKCPEKVLEETLKNYQSDAIYRGLIDEMCEFIKSNIDVDEIDYISGGERRDWFFSLIIAKFLNKPHITIYKDMTTVVSIDGKTEELKGLEGGAVLHIADLITEASSYERAWIPAIKNNGGKIKWSVVVIDRRQGGSELLKSHDVKAFSMVDIDINLFNRVLDMGLINMEQFEMIERYILDPKESMAQFLKKNPEFIKEALKADDKTRERANLCLQKDFYGLNVK
ncbi:orotate phosphoribosyltransferase [Acetivibrio mesophilus]|uniref:Orotate phosphoribosyltransferase n=1 Tax=Acetivibrio mesophilus TaxID=2487273 RepID=A0A4Q0I3V4_9FIRM|nr:orotate phosphoribosyltransferase [Acetivibrio mesophilus]ODM25367.1 orotate phosphoribosyltransferase [Clostridium sp. Bc-iso-3]RXE58447.1 orotate phosphoribosyltransferase [Acetivibrio mesophilus]HHV28671.1 orotate phosphoribosyltransferase [Clostridium sp.]